jgi:pSer/pThr/pTyr-binding forkhead associated (FHA) protein
MRLAGSFACTLGEVRAQQVEVLGAEIRPVELQTLVLAERRRVPFLFLRDAAGEVQLISLESERLVIGRAPGSDLEITWDLRVSGIHAYLEHRGSRWTIEDDGLSRNGTFVGGDRLQGQRVLRDGDVIIVGSTKLGFRDPGPSLTAATVVATDSEAPVVSDAQRRVLVELCRPMAVEGRSTPATNQEIADNLVLSLAAVKSHFSVLFERFGLEALPQNQKRNLLAERALSNGTVRSVDLLS